MGHLATSAPFESLSALWVTIVDVDGPMVEVCCLRLARFLPAPDVYSSPTSKEKAFSIVGTRLRGTRFEWLKLCGIMVIDINDIILLIFVVRITY